MFPFVSVAYQEAAFRGASQAPALRVTSSAHGCGRRTYISRSRLRSFNRCAARLAPRAERSAWGWNFTVGIRADLERLRQPKLNRGGLQPDAYRDHLCAVGRVMARWRLAEGGIHIEDHP